MPSIPFYQFFHLLPSQPADKNIEFFSDLLFIIDKTFSLYVSDKNFSNSPVCLYCFCLEVLQNKLFSVILKTLCFASALPIATIAL